MCMALPGGNRPALSGKPPGPVKLFVGGLALIAVLLLAAVQSWWHPAN